MWCGLVECEAKVVVEQATRECNELLVVIGSNTAEVETKATAAQEKEAQLKIDSEQVCAKSLESPPAKCVDQQS